MRMYLWWFKYLVFTHLPGESYHRQLRSLLFCLCDIFRMLINSLVCCFLKGEKCWQHWALTRGCTSFHFPHTPANFRHGWWTLCWLNNHGLVLAVSIALAEWQGVVSTTLAEWPWRVSTALTKQPRVLRTALADWPWVSKCWHHVGWIIKVGKLYQRDKHRHRISVLKHEKR